MAERALVVGREVEARRGVEVGAERGAWAEGLSDGELLGRVMAGSSGALSRASRLLGEIGGLSRLQFFEPALSDVIVAAPERERLKLALELARRLAWAEVAEGELLDSPAALARFLLQRYARVDQEVGGAVFLDAKRRLLAVRELFAGGLNQATVSPRPLLRAALHLGAASFAFFHTHTSTDPTPSLEDFHFTRRLKEAADLLSVSLADHLVLAQGGKWLSMHQAGRL